MVQRQRPGKGPRESSEMRHCSSPVGLYDYPHPLAVFTLPTHPMNAECCIFHRQRQFGEWSDGEDSDAECGECGEGGEQPQQAPPPQT